MSERRGGPVLDRRGEAVLEWHGPVAPPRKNGELVFDALWESRVFGMTMTLFEQGAFAWDEFRDRLIAAIGAWERAHHPDDASFHYWSCWLTAFESLVAAKGLCLPAAVDARVAELAARPAGHDHRPKETIPG
jgi:nitrile hydratase accessory protein